MKSTHSQNIPKKVGGRRIQTYLAVLSLILYIFTKISPYVQWLEAFAAVIYTDTLQFFIMIGGSFYVMIKGLYTVGGYSELQTKYLASIPEKLLSNSTCGLPRVDSWRMLRDADTSVSDMPWPGFLLGQIPASIWYWCADQVFSASGNTLLCEVNKNIFC
ncbi:sodium/glucose cotransporter 5-like [Penaeus monodon]|uniref:sodium/glucose cotransporter 5-like n=1 Tax=Penaeus monodon TaxID=6687 RepID=UPI0018A6EA9C|nr:sodium/glucose cotransporter 5-like [Penaeus monodon]